MRSSSVLAATAALVLAMFAASAMAQDAAAAPADPAAAAAPAAGTPAVPTTPTSEFNPRAAMSTMATYVTDHPDFIRGVIAWMLGGSILWVVGFILLLFSEIGAVLVVRDQDFRVRLTDGQFMSPAQGDEYQVTNNNPSVFLVYLTECGWQKLTSRENMKMSPRPYLSAAGLFFMFIGTSCLMYPLCDVLTIIGLPSAPCILLVTVGSLLATVCNVTFLLFLIWSCTRPWAALVFLIISFSGSVLLPSGNPILLIIWLLVAVGGGYAYFFYLPSTFEKEIPPYVQNIGDFTVEPNLEKIQTAFKDGYEVAKQEAVEKYEEAQKAALAASEKIKEEAEKAKKAAEEAAEKAKKAAEDAAKASANAASSVAGGNAETAEKK